MVNWQECRAGLKIGRVFSWHHWKVLEERAVFVQSEHIFWKEKNDLSQNLHFGGFMWAMKNTLVGWVKYPVIFRDYFINHDIRIPSLNNQDLFIGFSIVNHPLGFHVGFSGLVCLHAACNNPWGHHTLHHLDGRSRKNTMITWIPKDEQWWKPWNDIPWNTRWLIGILILAYYNYYNPHLVG